MEELIKFITEKTGLTSEQASSAVNAIKSYIKEKMPSGIGEQVSNFLDGKAGGGLAGMASSLKDKFGLK